MYHTNRPTSFDVLAECAHGYIGVCPGCHEFNFAYNNVAMTFQEEDMVRFCEWLTGNRFNPEHQYCSVQGRNIAFRSPLDNMFLIFKLEELEEINQMLQEAQLVLEARRLASIYE